MAAVANPSELSFDELLRLGINLQRIAHCCRDRTMTELSVYLSSKISPQTTAKDAADILHCKISDTSTIFHELPLHRTILVLSERLKNAPTTSVMVSFYPILTSVLLLATLTVTMRFLSRLTVKVSISSRIKRIATEDWLILVALVFNHTFGVAGIMGTFLYGIGNHTYMISYNQYLGAIKLTYSIALLYFPILFFVKVSLLRFYCRLAPDRTFHIIATATGVFVLVITIAADLLMALQCYPKKPWDDLPDELLRPKCLNENIVLWIHAVLNILTDCFILIMPIPIVMKLKLPFRSKISVMAVFGLGAIACVFSFLRASTLNDFNDSPDPMWVFGCTGSYTLLETSLAISCASLPMLKPFLLRYAPRVATAVFKTVKTSMESRSEGASNCDSTCTMVRLARRSKETLQRQRGGFRVRVPSPLNSPITTPQPSPGARTHTRVGGGDDYFGAGAFLGDELASKRNSKRISFRGDIQNHQAGSHVSQYIVPPKDLEAGLSRSTPDLRRPENDAIPSTHLSSSP